jgi:hypothetical protein
MTPPAPVPPRFLKGGLVLIEPETAKVLRIVPLQYNPQSIIRALQPEMNGGDAIGNRAGPWKFTGPPVETIQLELQLDATDQLEKGDASAASLGVLPRLSALEAAITPTAAQLEEAHRGSARGTPETTAMAAPICLFVWGQRRVVPVRILAFNVIEEEFDPKLNPIRAKVSLGLRVLSVEDLGFDGIAGRLYLQYLRYKEEEAAADDRGTLEELGLART